MLHRIQLGQLFVVFQKVRIRGGFSNGLALIIGFGEEFFLKAEIISAQVCRRSYENEGGFQGPQIPFSYI